MILHVKGATITVTDEPALLLTSPDGLCEFEVKLTGNECRIIGDALIKACETKCVNGEVYE